MFWIIKLVAMSTKQKVLSFPKIKNYLEKQGYTICTIYYTNKKKKYVSFIHCTTKTQKDLFVKISDQYSIFASDSNTGIRGLEITKSEIFGTRILKHERLLRESKITCDICIVSFLGIYYSKGDNIEFYRFSSEPDQFVNDEIDQNKDFEKEIKSIAKNEGINLKNKKKDFGKEIKSIAKNDGLKNKKKDSKSNKENDTSKVIELEFEESSSYSSSSEEEPKQISLRSYGDQLDVGLGIIYVCADLLQVKEQKNVSEIYNKISLVEKDIRKKRLSELKELLSSTYKILENKFNDIEEEEESIKYQYEKYSAKLSQIESLVNRSKSAKSVDNLENIKMDIMNSMREMTLKTYIFGDSVDRILFDYEETLKDLNNNSI